MTETPPVCLCGHGKHHHHFWPHDPAPGCYGAGEERGVRLCRCQGFVEAHAVGYIIEFSDGGPPERHIVRICDEKAATRTAAAFEALGVMPFDGDRPVVYGHVFTAPVSSLEPGEAVVSSLWADGPKAAIQRLSRPDAPLNSACANTKHNYHDRCPGTTYIGHEDGDPVNVPCSCPCHRKDDDAPVSPPDR